MPTAPLPPSTLPAGGRLLVVDDEYELMTVLSETLGREGFEVTGRVSGDAALEALRDQPPFDLLLTDLMMPGLDGLGLLKAALDLDPQLVCVMMTGQGTVQTAVDAMKVGAFDYILKPFKLSAMLPVLTRAMEARRLRVENLQLRESVAIYELAQTLAFTLDADVILAKLADAALQQSEADEASVMLLAPEGEALVVAAVRGQGRGYLAGERVPLATGIAGWVARFRETLELNGEVRDPRFTPLHPRPEIRHALCVPMLAGNDFVGVLNVNVTRQRRPLTLRDAKALSILAGLSAAALQNARLLAQVQANEKRFRVLIENAPDAITLFDPDGTVRYDSPAAQGLLGYDPEELLGTNAFERIHPDDRAATQAVLQQLVATPGVKRSHTFRFRHKAGDWRWMEAVGSNMLAEPSVQAIVVNYRDITERRQAEQALRENEEYFRSLIENVSDIITVLNSDGIILYESPSIERVLGYKSEELLGQNAFELVHPEELADTVEAFARGLQSPESTPLVEARFRHKDGSWRVMELIGKSALDRAKQVIGIVNARDITQRKQVEAALWETESQLRAVLNNAPITIFATNSHGVFTLSAGKGLEPVGLKPGENVGVSAFDLYGSLPFAEYTGKVTTGEDVIRRVLAGEEVTALTELHGVYFDNHIGPQWGTDGKVAGLVGVAIDVTERKQAEDTLRDSEARYRTLFEQSPNGVLLIDLETGKTIEVNETAHKQLGYTRDEFAALRISDYEVLEKPEETARHMQKVAREGSDDFETLHRTKSGEIRNMHVWARTVQLRDRVLFYAIFQDITKRKQAETEIKRQLERLAALRAIDSAIIASLDLRVTLNVILDQVTTQVRVDAADVLLLNPHLQTLEYAAGRGFRSQAIERSRVPLGQGYAGLAALERRTVGRPNLAEEEPDLARTPLLWGEDFQAHYVVPLIAKGRVAGVLEVFHRAPLSPDQEWLDFFETLAQQAAIAVESARLFESLQRSNTDLALAYDATIEGWSRAMDLRDKETEGHAQRVTELTERLARAMGLGEAELVHVRRGGLLHDIGKMGVPDGILLKPGPLSDDEWKVMRLHPQLAHDMLAPIAYLKPALAIPYCHHEKWDGGGYPRGLKGEQIPLAARLFAVVDVWDALRSDRPYRKGWPIDDVEAYLREQSGKHFDPQAVEVFLKIVAEGTRP